MTNWRKILTLESVLIASVVLLAIQAVPSGFYRRVLAFMDVRTWTSQTWFWVNACVFFSMFSLRMGGPILRIVSKLVTGPRSEAITSVPNKKSRREMDEERRLYKRMIEARKKRPIP